jgi:hypothetical protein
MTRKDHVDQQIKVLLHLAYSANKGKRWRRKQLGLVDSDLKTKDSGSVSLATTC